MRSAAETRRRPLDRHWLRGLLAAALALAGVLAAQAPAGARNQQVVKYLVVPPPHNGVKTDLYDLAQSVLGAGNRYAEVFALNRNRLEPDGARFTDPTAIYPGWILVLPADAQGPLVRSGPLPRMAPADPTAGTDGIGAGVTPARVPLPGHGPGPLDIAPAFAMLLLLALGIGLARSHRTGRAAEAGPAPPTAVEPAEAEAMEEATHQRAAHAGTRPLPADEQGSEESGDLDATVLPFTAPRTDPSGPASEGAQPRGRTNGPAPGARQPGDRILLPVYLVVDESVSMSICIDDLNAGLALLHTALRGDPSAAARIRLAVLGFSTDVAVRLELTDPRLEAEPPQLHARDVTNYGAAFTELLTRIPADVAGLQAAGHRVCRPAVFFITDGKPTDHWEAQHERLVNRETTKAAPDIIAWGVGEADARTIMGVASREEFAYVSNEGLPLREAIAQFCLALTASLTRSGRSLARGKAELVVERPPGFRRVIDVGVERPPTGRSRRCSS